MFYGLFKPQFLFKTTHLLWKIAAILCCLFFGLGVYFSLFNSPPDYQQGDYVRFMYLHVPASWLALGIYSCMAIFSIVAFVGKIPTATLLTRALAIPGAFFCGVSLVTGSLWGKVTWGTYWAWDARLTSMLLLFFMYMGYIGFSYSKYATLKSLRLCSVLVIIGWVNIPLIKWSVDFWFTLHQSASLMRFAKPAIDTVFMTPLFLMCLSYIAFTVMLTSLWYQAGLPLLKSLNLSGKTK